MSIMRIKLDENQEPTRGVLKLGAGQTLSISIYQTKIVCYFDNYDTEQSCGFYLEPFSEIGKNWTQIEEFIGRLKQQVKARKARARALMGAGKRSKPNVEDADDKVSAARPEDDGGDTDDEVAAGPAGDDKADEVQEQEKE